MENLSHNLSRYADARTLLILLLGALMLLIVLGATGDAEAVTWENDYTIHLNTNTYYESIATDGDEVYVAYMRRVSINAYAYVKHYNGTAWSSEVPVTGTAKLCAIVKVEAFNGTAHFAYVDVTDRDEDIYYTSWKDGIWARESQVSSPIAGVDSSEPAISVDEGKVHIVWVSGIDGDSDIYYRSLDGLYWSSTGMVNLDSRTEAQDSPDVHAEAGNVHFIWRDSRRGDWDIFYRSYNGTWGIITEVSKDASSEMQRYPSVTVSDFGVHVVYSHFINNDFQTYMTTNDGAWSTPVYIGKARGGGEEIAPQVDAEGQHIVLTYHVPTANSNLVFRHYNNGRWAIEENVIANPASGHWYQFPYIALEKGVVHLVYNDFDSVGRLSPVMYTSTALDKTPPNAWLEVLDPYWMNTSRWSFHWYAGDDYMITTVTLQYRYSTDNVTWDRWTELSTIDIYAVNGNGMQSFTPADGDGHYQFKAYARDISGKSEAPTMDPEAMNGWDTGDPIGSISINNMAAATNSSSVTLVLTYIDEMSGVANIRFDDDSIGGDEPWENPVATKEWTLGTEEGEYTVAYQIMDVSGRLSRIYTDSILLDLADPYGTITMTIDSEWTNTREVSLDLTYGDTGSGAAKVRFADEAVGGDEPWDNPVDTKQWTLPEGEGMHTIAYQVMDAAGRMSEVYTVTVGLDTVAPTGSIIMGGSDTFTTERMVTLTLTYEDATSGVSKVRFMDEAVGGDEPWDNPVETKEWDLGETGGVMTVYFQVMDVAGHVSEVYSDTIILDTDKPTGAIALQGGGDVVNDPNIMLALTYSDETSAVVGIRVTNEAVGGDEPWDNPLEAMAWELTAGDGEKTVYYQVLDEAGHVSPVYTLGLTLDSSNPFVDNSDPEDGAIDEKVDVNIVVRFSKAMNQTVTSDATSMWYVNSDGNTVTIAVDISWSPDSKTMTIAPLSNLTHLTEFTWKITTAATDTVGNELYPEVQYTFTTEKGDDGGNGGDGNGDEGGISGLVIALVIIVVVLVVVVAIFMMREQNVE